MIAAFTNQVSGEPGAAQNALAGKIDPFELARVMGTSVRMIERHYGTLLSSAAAGIAARLDAFEAEQDAQADPADA